MTDTDKSQDPYEDGSVPADADLNPDGGDVAEGADEPDSNARDIRPDGSAPLL